jgi:hypothetical protein
MKTTKTLMYSYINLYEGRMELGGYRGIERRECIDNNDMAKRGDTGSNNVGRR